MLVEVVQVPSHLKLCLFHVDWRANGCSSSEEIKLRDRARQDNSTHGNAEAKDFALLYLAVLVVKVIGWLAKIIKGSSTVELVCLEHQLITASILAGRSVADDDDTEAVGDERVIEVADSRRILASCEAWR